MSSSDRPTVQLILFLQLLVLTIISSSNALVHPSYPYCEHHLGQFVRIHTLPSKYNCHLRVNGRWACDVSLQDQTRLPEGSEDTMCAFPRSGRIPGFLLEYSSTSSSMLTVWDFGQSDMSIHDWFDWRPRTGLFLLKDYRLGAVNRTVDTINFSTPEEATRCGQEAIKWCEYLEGTVKVALLRNDTQPPWVSVDEPILICELTNPDSLRIEVLTFYFGIDHWTNDDFRRALHIDEQWDEVAAKPRFQRPIARMEEEEIGWGNDPPV